MPWCERAKANNQRVASLIFFGARVLSKVIRARYEGGVLKPLEKLELRDGEEVVIVLEEDIVEFARRIRGLIRAREEPGELLSRERDRFEAYRRH